ncbi:MAG: CGNR zinc finger domain-containing protein [Streptosporangiaceae bacterium]
MRAFVNTRDIELGADELGSPEALAGWLTARGLGDGQAGGAATAGDLRTALGLRESLREVLLAHAVRTEPGPAAAGLASIAAGLPVRLGAGADGAVRMAAAGAGVAAGLAGLLLIAAEAATSGTWARLKVCGADDCRWAFYDRSPARSGCWCSMAICGSRAKSRAYRRRSRPDAGQG